MENNNYLKSLNILYIEDDNITSSQMLRMLNKLFKNVLVAKDGLEGLLLFKNNKVDLIISDINMPKLNGLEMLEKIREFDTNIPIIFTTARNEADSIIRAIELEVSDYILKPIEFDNLINKIKIVSEKIKSKSYHILLEQYKLVVDQKSLVIKFDINKKIKYVNEEFENITGYRKEEVLNRFFDEELDSFKTEEEHINMWEHLLVENLPWKGRLSKKIKNGSNIILDTSIVPIFDVDNNLEEYILISNDITEIEMYNNLLKFKVKEHKNSMQNKAYLLNEYKKSLESSTLHIRFNSDFKIDYINKSLLKLLKKPFSKIKNRDFSSLLYKKDSFDIKEKFLENKTFYELLILNSQNKKVYINFSFSAIYDKDNNLVEYIALGNDISEIINLYEEIEKTQVDVIFSLGSIGELRSKETGNHVKRVSEYSYLLAKKYGLSEEEAKLLRLASPMHDIGKIGIPDSILSKPSKLNDSEYEIMKTHASIGYEMLGKSNRELLKTSGIIAHEHHEHWDGGGYPRGIKGEDINIFGRIVSISDVFDALINKRCYKDSWHIKEVKDYFYNQKGKQFDPNLTTLFLDYFDEFLEINNKYID